MKKEEFFKQLEYLLQDIPDEDREEALDYYRDYLAEAGSENEEQAIEDFGSPERVAAIIRADAAGNLKDGGSFTETGYEDERFRDPNYQVAKRLDLPEEKKPESHGKDHGADGAESAGDRGYAHVEKKPWSNRLLRIVLWCILIVAALPVAVGALGIGFGGISGALALAFGIVVTLVCLTAAAVILGVILVVLGLVFLVSMPYEGLFLLGIGVIGMGCGILGAVILYAIAALFFPFVWNGLKMLFGRLAGKGKEAKRP